MPQQIKSSYSPLPVPSSYSYDSTVITNSISAALSIIDKDFRIIWVNNVMQGFFGPLDELKGRHCYEVYEKRKKVCHGCPTAKVFKHELNKCVSLRRNILVNNEKYRKRKHFKLTATPIRDDKGNIVQVLEHVEDVTDELKVESRIKKKLHTISKEINFIFKLDRQFICSEESSLDKVLKQSAEIAPTLVDAKICNLRLVDSYGKILTSRTSKGLSKKYVSKSVMEIGEGITGKVGLAKKPLVVKDMLGRKDAKFPEFIKNEGLHSLISVPILLKNELLGTLTVYDKKIATFTKSDSRLLMNFANHIAILIDNIKTHKKIFTSYINTIKALVSAVEARDTYTRGHSEKVTKFAMDIAAGIGLPKDDKVMLAYCGRLHDIGKIAISDSILNKRGTLTAAEMAEIHLHPAKGVEILSNLKFLEEGMPAIRHHHERYDGKGYPEGLKGKDIPILARIIGCADAFDAMTSDRAYRPKMNAKKALEELKVNRKKQFDPEIITAFTSILKSQKLT
ncbi:MAG: HD domain-containing phosphohydrolase [Candidatus Omnitrophota bacterium]